MNGFCSVGFLFFGWTYRPDDAVERLSLILFKYSDGLIKWFEPSGDPFGKLGGTNGNTNCLFTRFGPPVRCDCWPPLNCVWYVWYSSDDICDDALPAPAPTTFVCCCADNVPLISLAFLFAATIRDARWKKNGEKEKRKKENENISRNKLMQWKTEEDQPIWESCNANETISSAWLCASWKEWDQCWVRFNIESNTNKFNRFAVHLASTQLSLLRSSSLCFTCGPMGNFHCLLPAYTAFYVYFAVYMEYSER